MPDKRTEMQKRIDKAIGMPLYYCADCLRAVDVKVVAGAEPIIKRPCGPECGAGIIAPRRAIVTATGGASGTSAATKLQIFWYKLAAALTGRCV